jgi:hypothetical protein
MHRQNNMTQHTQYPALKPRALYNSSTPFYSEYVGFQPSAQQLKKRSEQQFYNFIISTNATIYMLYKNT